MILEKIIEIYHNNNFIKDFLISEIFDDNVCETIDFINSSDNIKKQKYGDIIYVGDLYEGNYLEGNQYLIGNYFDDILLINYVNEEYSKKECRMILPKKDFEYIVQNKKQIIHR